MPNSTEGIVEVNDLPQPLIVLADRNFDHRPCLRYGHLAYRHPSGQRRLHDRGDLRTGGPVGPWVTFSSHYVRRGRGMVVVF